MELYREYPAWLIFLRRTYGLQRAFWRCLSCFSGKTAPALQLPAPRLVENQRETGVDGSAEKATGDFY